MSVSFLQRGRLKKQQLLNLSKLLDMLYTPAELAEIVGFTRRQVYRVYMHMECPHIYDETHHLWINGAEFREWIHKTYSKTKLAPDETFCLTCKTAVQIIAPEKKISGDITYILSNCPVCGRRLTRIIEKKRKDNYDFKA
jgi:hypothetical protein